MLIMKLGLIECFYHFETSCFLLYLKIHFRGFFGFFCPGVCKCKCVLSVLCGWHFPSQGFLCSVFFLLGLSCDPYAGMLTKRGDMGECQQSPWGWVCENMCVWVCVWVQIHVNRWCRLSHLSPCVCALPVCVSVSIFIYHSGCRRTVYENVCVSQVNLFKGAYVFDRI